LIWISMMGQIRLVGLTNRCTTFTFMLYKMNYGNSKLVSSI
jgi:hypothetical protein